MEIETPQEKQQVPKEVNNDAPLQIQRDETKKLTRIIHNLIENEDSFDFRKPVYYRALGLDDYKKIVKKPMDINTVRRNLSKFQYLLVDDIVRDIFLIWNNCKLYNEEGSEIWKKADLMEKYSIKIIQENFQGYQIPDPQLMLQQMFKELEEDKKKELQKEQEQQQMKQKKEQEKLEKEKQQEKNLKQQFLQEKLQKNESSQSFSQLLNEKPVNQQKQQKNKQVEPQNSLVSQASISSLNNLQPTSLQQELELAKKLENIDELKEQLKKQSPYIAQTNYNSNGGLNKKRKLSDLDCIYNNDIKQNKKKNNKNTALIEDFSHIQNLNQDIFQDDDDDEDIKIVQNSDDINNQNQQNDNIFDNDNGDDLIKIGNGDGDDKIDDLLQLIDEDVEIPEDLVVDEKELKQMEEQQKIQQVLENVDDPKLRSARVNLKKQQQLLEQQKSREKILEQQRKRQEAQKKSREQQIQHKKRLEEEKRLKAQQYRLKQKQKKEEEKRLQQQQQLMNNQYSNNSSNMKSNNNIEAQQELTSAIFDDEDSEQNQDQNDIGDDIDSNNKENEDEEQEGSNILFETYQPPANQPPPPIITSKRLNQKPKQNKEDKEKDKDQKDKEKPSKNKEKKEKQTIVQEIDMSNIQLGHYSNYPIPHTSLIELSKQVSQQPRNIIEKIMHIISFHSPDIISETQTDLYTIQFNRISHVSFEIIKDLLKNPEKYDNLYIQKLENIFLRYTPESIFQFKTINTLMNEDGTPYQLMSQQQFQQEVNKVQQCYYRIKRNFDNHSSSNLQMKTVKEQQKHLQNAASKFQLVDSEIEEDILDDDSDISSFDQNDSMEQYIQEIKEQKIQQEQEKLQNYQQQQIQNSSFIQPQQQQQSQIQQQAQQTALQLQNSQLSSSQNVSMQSMIIQQHNQQQKEKSKSKKSLKKQ